MNISLSDQHAAFLPVLSSVFLSGGVEIRVDLRLACLAAALTAVSAPAPSEHTLVTTTRNRLQPLQTHPSVQWLRAKVEEFWLLGLAMRTAQLGNPPTFLPCELQKIPSFVQKYFPEPPLDEVSHHLMAFWQDAQVLSLLEAQSNLWGEVAEDVKSVLAPVDVVAFEELFFGHYSSHLVVVPLANLVPSWVNGVGVGNQQETYAVCCLKSAQPYQAHPLRMLDLAQHEASHPVLAEIQQISPNVPDACAFVEQAFPPGGRFAQIYEDHDSRWAEMVIRASTWFFLRELGKKDEALAHIQGQREQGITAIDAYIAALEPWWRERRAGRAPGLDAVLDQLPSWFHL